MIEIAFTSPVSPERQGVFEAAAERWDAVAQIAFPTVEIDGRSIDGLLIEASVAPIDGAQGVLGRAGPTHLRPDGELPAKGVMEFDLADVERLEGEGAFADVILHEMGHVLGIGTLWDRMGLLRGRGTDDPGFVGPNAVREYGALRGRGESRPVPVANTGGPGTREGHWRELVFGDELMTGFLSGARRPLSRLTVASLEDLGYAVRYEAADPFGLPSFLELAEKGVAEAVRSLHLCRMGRPEPVVIGR
ncbi:MAG: leishmanolysin-related zinc metalloendopeptidase [Inquilinaceae bacterium]